MPIIPAGQLNVAALVVPNLYVQIQPPQPLLNGVPSGIIGVVGVASWGPLNTPTPFGSYAEYQGLFGALLNATFDMGTVVAIGVQQGANSFVGVRVSDGTDVKASEIVGTTDITYTARYSGTTGNSIRVTIAAGGAASSFNVSVSLPGVLTENFTNVTGTGNAFWVNLASAVTNGQGPLRGASQLITAVAGSGTDAPTLGTVALTGGTNGTSGVTAATLVGSNGLPRTGMYTLAKQNVSVLLLADLTDDTQWSVLGSFAETIGAYAITSFAASESITAAVTAMQTVGAYSSWLKVMHGDWLYWYDQVNQITRLVNPASFAAGIIAALDPSQSSLNKQLTAIIGSQTAGVVGSPQQYTYTDADLSTLFSAGIDLICNPAPGGNYWAVRAGINSSLNGATNGDNYTRMTDFLAATLDAGMGIFVGQKITTSMDRSAVATITAFLVTVQQAGLLNDPSQPLPATVTGGLGPNTPNPMVLTEQGIYTINVAVTYSPINRFFIINLQGGQTVVTSQPLNTVG
jgi:hypothetical protein